MDDKGEVVLVCINNSTGEISRINRGSSFCRKSLLTYLGLSNKYVPSFECKYSSNTHYCQRLSQEEIDKYKTKIIRTYIDEY